MSKHRRNLLRNKHAIVGIEAAIILIAFVVIASALAYVVINMGFYSAQKAKETITRGVMEATSALQLDGSVTAKTNSTRSLLYVAFPVKLSVGRSEVDLNENATVVSIGGSVSLLDIYKGVINETSVGLEEDPSDLDEIITKIYQKTVSGEVIATGDGTELTFSGTLEHYPVVPSTVTITATVGAAPVIVTDDGASALSGTGVTGSITYSTGEWSLVFTTAPDLNEDVLADYKYYPSAPAAYFIMYNDDDDSVLENFEKGYLVISLGKHGLQEYDLLKIEIRTGSGAALMVQRAIPGGLPVVDYIDLE